MRGAVAAGHTLTAEAGAEVLREGGNAVDACIAAAAMSWVVESPVTGPGAAGFLLVRASSTGVVRLHDFFAAIPGDGLDRPVGEMEEVDVEFDRDASQIFRIGAASCAVPGAIAGLETAHRAYARLPWRRLLEPAIAAARGGFELNRTQDLRAGGKPTRAPRSARDVRPRQFARAACGRGSRCVLRRRARPPGLRVRTRGRRQLDRARSRSLPRDLATADPGPVRRPRVRLESATLVRRSPDRLWATAALAPRHRRAGGERRNDSAARRGDARANSRPWGQLRERPLPRRSAQSPLRRSRRRRHANPRAGSGPARNRRRSRDDAHLRR